MASRRLAAPLEGRASLVLERNSDLLSYSSPTPLLVFVRRYAVKTRTPASIVLQQRLCIRGFLYYRSDSEELLGSRLHSPRRSSAKFAFFRASRRSAMRKR